MGVIGLILLLLGIFLGIAILKTLGIILLVVGIVFFLVQTTRHGRYWW